MEYIDDVRCFDQKKMESCLNDEELVGLLAHQKLTKYSENGKKKKMASAT
jgi:hypothetical protein